MTVRLSHVSKAYGDLHVLRDVSFTIEDGGVYCLMGPSGAGKTTLLRVLLGLEPADGGTVEGVREARVSMMFQEDRLCNQLTPVENVVLVMPGKASRRKARDLLAEILPDEALNKPAIQLSGGQRRRVSLARAMAYPSGLVVMDEPFTGLDKQTRQTVIDFILRHRNGRSMLISTHGEDDARLLDAETVQLTSLFGA